MAKAIAMSKEFRRCAICSKRFEVAKGTLRTGKRYCSTSCKFKAFRWRRDEAKRLFEAGMSYYDIAKQLDADEKTVMNWVAYSRKNYSSQQKVTFAELQKTLELDNSDTETE